MLTVIIFILILGLLVFVHEFGHFVVARKAGIKVHEFALGFPPRLFGWYRDPATGKNRLVWGKGTKDQKIERSKDYDTNSKSGQSSNLSIFQSSSYPSTLYSLNLLPLGGFVKIKGENGEDAEDADSFGHKKAWVRATVLAAGVTMNFLLAAVVLSVGFMIGLPSDVSLLEDKQAILVGEPKVMVQEVEKGSPADLAGIKSRDTVVSINGEKVTDGEKLREYIFNHQTEELSFVVARGEETETLVMTPKVLEGMTDRARVGVLLVDAAMVRYPWYIAIYKGFVAAVFTAVNIVIAFWYLIRNLATGHGLAFDVAGPVGIAVIIGDSARLGINYLLNTIAMLSLSLAVINILPIPALDGGRILFIGLEKILRRPVPMKYEQMAHTIGFVLLMGLIVAVTWRDVAGLF
ncbi:MAG: M50 family metallopeptidase [Patescibacteria group bacterium]